MKWGSILRLTLVEKYQRSNVSLPLFLIYAVGRVSFDIVVYRVSRIEVIVDRIKGTGKFS